MCICWEQNNNFLTSKVWSSLEKRKRVYSFKASKNCKSSLGQKQVSTGSLKPLEYFYKIIGSKCRTFFGFMLPFRTIGAKHGLHF